MVMNLHTHGVDVLCGYAICQILSIGNRLRPTSKTSGTARRCQTSTLTLTLLQKVQAMILAQGTKPSGCLV